MTTRNPRIHETTTERKRRGVLARIFAAGAALAPATMGNLADYFAIALSAIAAGSVTGGTGALTAGPFGQVTAARTGAGVYTLTLISGASALGAANCLLMLTLKGNSGIIRYAHTSATVDRKSVV